MTICQYINEFIRTNTIFAIGSCVKYLASLYFHLNWSGENHSINYFTKSLFQHFLDNTWSFTMHRSDLESVLGVAMKNISCKILDWSGTILKWSSKILTHVHFLNGHALLNFIKDPSSFLSDKIGHIHTLIVQDMHACIMNRFFALIN